MKSYDPYAQHWLNSVTNPRRYESEIFSVVLVVTLGTAAPLADALPL